MLLGVHRLLGRRITFPHARQTAALLVALVVAAFLIEREVAGRNSTTCPVARRACWPVPSVSSIVVRSSRAEAIWLAIARFHTRSYSRA